MIFLLNGLKTERKGGREKERRREEMRDSEKRRGKGNAKKKIVRTQVYEKLDWITIQTHFGFVKKAFDILGFQNIPISLNGSANAVSEIQFEVSTRFSEWQLLILP